MFRDSLPQYIYSLWCVTFSLSASILWLSSPALTLLISPCRPFTFSWRWLHTGEDKRYSLIPFLTSYYSMHTSCSRNPKSMFVHTSSWEERALDRGSRAYSLSAVRWMMVLFWSLIWSASFSLVCLERSRGRDNGQQWGSYKVLSQWAMMLNDNDTVIITELLSGCKSSFTSDTV